MNLDLSKYEDPNGLKEALANYKDEIRDNKINLKSWIIYHLIIELSLVI